MSFGETLRQLRKSQRIGIRELSKQLRYDRSYLSRVENNAVCPSDELIKAAAKFFRVPEENLRVSAGKFPQDVLDILAKRPQEAVSILREFPTKSSMTGVYCCGKSVEISDDTMSQDHTITFRATCGHCKTSFKIVVSPPSGSQGWWVFRGITLGQFEFAMK